MRTIDVRTGKATLIEGVEYPVDVSSLSAASVAIVVWPDRGSSGPWLEREPFQGREHDDVLLANAEALMAEAEARHADNGDAAPFEEHKKAKYTELYEAYGESLAPVTDRYPLEERETWRKQEEEARAFLANPGASTPYLAGLNQGRARSMRELAEKIIEKADTWTALSSSSTNKLQALRDQVDAIQLADYPSEAEAKAALDAIRW